MSQSLLARLVGASENAISRGLRGQYGIGVPRYLKFAIVAWRIMTPEQRKQLAAELDAADRDDGA